MAETVTPSMKTMLDGQINKAVANYRALLERHACEFPADAVQTVLGQREFADEQFFVFRRRVEVVSKMIVRRVRVDRGRTHKQAIDATGRSQWINSKVLETAPKGEEEDVDVYFFRLDYDPTGYELDYEMNLLGLKPDVDALAAVNEADPAFAEDRPNVTQWRDKDGKACCAEFILSSGHRMVYIYRRDDNPALCLRGRRFAGVRK